MIYYYRIFVKHKIQWSAIKGDYSKFMSKNIELGLGKIQSVFINPYVACNNNCAYCAIGDANKLSCKIDYNILNLRTKKMLEFISEIKEELEDNC